MQNLQGEKMSGPKDPYEGSWDIEEKYEVEYSENEGIQDMDGVLEAILKEEEADENRSN